MPQDAFTIKYIAKELDSLLTGGKISRITQTGKDLLTFIIYTRKGTFKLEICLSAKGCRINITENDSAAPLVAPNFCMLLRKHLQNAQITRIGQKDNERIVFIDFNCTSEFELEKMTLYAELMGKYSNAVLVKDGVIVAALKTSAIGESTKRVLFTGVKYTLPEPQDKLAPDNYDQIKRAFNEACGDRIKFIAERIKGVSYATASDIFLTFGENMTADDVFGYLNGKEISPCVEYENGAPRDFKARSASADKKLYNSLLEAQTAYYSLVTREQEFSEKKRKLNSALSSSVKKLEKRLGTIEQKLADCEDAENVKLKAELITANIYAIKRGADGFEAVNYYDEKGGKIKITLDKTLSPSENAQKYYKKYAKLKRTAIAAESQRAETKKSLDYFYGIASSIRLAENTEDLTETEDELKALGLIKEQPKQKKKAETGAPFRTYNINGFKISAGRNNAQNDRLLKNMRPDDLWLHTQGYHSSHVAVHCGGREVPDSVLCVAAEICAYYSDGREGSKIPVDYAKRQFVKKPPKSPLGFVIYTDFKTILVAPDAHAELREE